MNKENRKTLQGRPIESGSKKNKVKRYIAENPTANPTAIAKALNISRTTVYKYLQ